MVFESKDNFPSEFEAIRVIAGRLGYRVDRDAAEVGAAC